MTADKFELDWELEIEHEASEQIEQALAPDTDEHAELSVDEGTLVARGSGPAGESLHTLDDLLACASAAEDAIDTGED